MVTTDCSCELGYDVANSAFSSFLNCGVEERGLAVAIQRILGTCFQ